MKHCLYFWLYRAFATLILCGVLCFLVSNIMTATNPEGLKVIETTESSIILDAGSTKLQISLGKPDEINVGDYMPVIDEIKPYVHRVVMFNGIVGTILCVVYILDVSDVFGIVKKAKAKRGMKLAAVVDSYKHFLPGLYVIKVLSHGQKYSARFPAFKFELKYYPLGKDCVVWNGGYKNIWVDLDAYRS